MSTWRDRLRPIVAAVIAANAGADPRVLRRALRDAYPSYRRSGWIYQVWLDEIARQTGKRKRAKKRIRGGRKLRSMTAEERAEWMRERQIPLFGGDQQ